MSDKRFHNLSFYEELSTELFTLYLRKESVITILVNLTGSIKKFCNL
jgi:hypothetical protein